MSHEYAKEITPVLCEIENKLWEIDSQNTVQPYDYSEKALIAASKIYMSICMDKLWNNQEKYEISTEERIKQA